MSEITLVRHGQANTSARDEHSYDRLSPLGHQQAQWLGDHLRSARHDHSRIYCGTLNRHRETALSMGYDDSQLIRDPRLNEMEYFTLAQAMEQEHGLRIPDEREAFVSHMPKVFSAWEAGIIQGAPESWSDFAGRTEAAMTEISTGDGPALVVTSGGLISMVMRHCLGLDTMATARMALAILNTSLHRLHNIGGHWSPVLFNAIPHLETPDRHYARTHL